MLLKRLSLVPLLLKVGFAFLAGSAFGCQSTTDTAADASADASVAGSAQSVATDLVLQDMDGVEHHVDASLAAGRPVVLVFWQTWCGPCRREAPELGRAAREHAESIDFFGVVPGTDEFVDGDEVRRVAAEWELPYPQVRDRDLALTERFGVSGTPDIVVLAPSGQVAYRGHTAPAEWSFAF